jgi:hypothetical protein
MAGRRADALNPAKTLPNPIYPANQKDALGENRLGSYVRQVTAKLGDFQVDIRHARTLFRASTPRQRCSLSELQRSRLRQRAAKF